MATRKTGNNFPDDTLTPMMTLPEFELFGNYSSGHNNNSSFILKNHLRYVLKYFVFELIRTFQKHESLDLS